MPDLSKIKLDGTTYNLKDTVARDGLATIPTKINDLTEYKNFGIGYIDCTNANRYIFVSNVTFGSSYASDFSSYFLLMFIRKTENSGSVTIAGTGNFKFYDINSNTRNGYVAQISSATISFTAVLLPALALSVFCSGSNDFIADYNKKTGCADSLWLIAFGIGACMTINTIVSVIFSFLPNFGRQNTFRASFDDFGVFMLMLVVTAVVPAICEETAFRGFAVNVLKNSGEVYAAIISALVFGLMHSGLSSAVFAFISGLIFAYIRKSSGRLIVPVVVHFLNNAFALFYGAAAGVMKPKAYTILYLFAFIAAMVIMVVSFIVLAKRKIGVFADDEPDYVCEQTEPSSGKSSSFVCAFSQRTLISPFSVTAAAP